MADELEQELIKRAVQVPSVETGKPESYGTHEAARAMAPIWGMDPQEAYLQMRIDRGNFKDQDEYYQTMVALETLRKFRERDQQLAPQPKK
jgi:hypothetical protein